MPLSRELLRTNCDRCLFKKMDEDIQYGCEAQNLRGAQFDLVPGTNNESVYLFKTKICQYKREQPWGTGSLESDLVAVRDEVKIRYALIIKGGELEDVQRTVDSVISNKIKPSRIVVFTNDAISDKLDGYLDSTGIPWQLTEYVDEKDWRVFAMMDLGIWTHFFTFITAGFEVKPDFFDELDQAINDREFRFTHIENSTNDFLLMSKNLYYFNELPLNELLKQLKAKNEGYQRYEFFPKN